MQNSGLFGVRCVKRVYHIRILLCFAFCLFFQHTANGIYLVLQLLGCEEIEILIAYTLYSQLGIDDKNVLIFLQKRLIDIVFLYLAHGDYYNTQRYTFLMSNLRLQRYDALYARL